MPSTSSIAMALRAPGDQPRYFRPQPQSDQHFHFVDFWQEKPLVLPVEECSRPPTTALYYAPPEGPYHSKEAYLNLLGQCIAWLTDAQVAKIVFSRQAFWAQQPGAWALFEQLCTAYPAAAVYCFSHPQAGTWLGASPETLLASSGSRLETMSLAGTRSAEQNGAFADKEKHEQQLVTDFILQTLSEQPGLGELEIQARTEHKAGALRHLLTRVGAQKKPDFDLTACLRALHPTPAVAGFPRREALQFLRAHEGYPRRYYAGYFGLQRDEQSHFWVNLRCAQLVDGGLQLYAGGGITAESEALAEWEETQAKMQTILNVLSLKA